jgi:NAD-dependent dihydropyrimidine dehydrogenase PreA subunit
MATTGRGRGYRDPHRRSGVSGRPPLTGTPQSGYSGYMRKATITEAKNQLSALIDRVRHGETIVITDRGRPVARGLLLASADAPSLDFEAARLSGFDPESIPTVRLSLEQGRIPRGGAEVVGDPAEPMPFRPAPGSPCDWPLPGLLKRILRGAVAPPPRFDANSCSGCGVCSEACPAQALRPGFPPELSQEACIRCYCCQELCPAGAVRVSSRRLLGYFRRAGG